MPSDDAGIARNVGQLRDGAHQGTVQGRDNVRFEDDGVVQDIVFLHRLHLLKGNAPVPGLK